MTVKQVTSGGWQTILVACVAAVFTAWMGWVSLTLIRLEIEVSDIHKEIISQRTTIPEVVEKSFAEIRDKANVAAKEQSSQNAELMKSLNTVIQSLNTNTQAIEYLKDSQHQNRK
jgi:hypothetical protein